MNWHLLPLSEIVQLLNTTPSGIDAVTASEHLREHGKNQIEDKKKKTILQMLLHQLLDFMILILITAAVISGILGDVTDAVIILAIVVINAFVGFIQEYRAEKAMEALKNMAANHARILREGKMIDTPASDLVPGDVVVLEAGNIIPADVRFFETHQVKVDESALTGESNNVEKNPEELSAGDYPLGDRANMGYKGTSITSGRALAYVVATGMNTELGNIAKMIQTDETTTPLQKRLTAFGKRLSVTILIICTVIFLIGWLRGESVLTMLITSISLAVAAIPEALPALVTIALAFGAKKLAKSNALIRKLPAVETLGSVTYICSDKTGTLTLNKMTVQEIFETSDTKYDAVFAESNMLLHIMALNNDVSKEENGKWLGDSTEVALVQYAFDKNLNRADLELKFPRIAELPFDSKRKCMTTIHQIENPAADQSTAIIVITKGAVDVLFDKLNVDQKSLIPEFELKVNEMAEKGYRVLGYAMKILPSLPENLDADEIETELTLIGFAGMIDPPREEARQAVTECKEAGIIPVMITGDHKLTAKAIAEKLGIISTDEDLVLTGPELTALTQIEFINIVEKVKVYARVNPEQKLRIINALQSKNHFVAMTGDGVNDAPALKNADIGIAMGINGTEVSKEASHMILLDDNFATIVVAIKHGRKIFDNILKFIKYIMTGNSGEIWAIFLAPFFGLPIPLLAIHILWINLVTDGLPGLALASEPSESNIMKRPPRNPKENIFSNGMAIHILWVGFLMGAVTIGMQAWAIHSANTHWQTMAFTVLCFSQLGHVIIIRSGTQSIFKIGFFSNKPMLGALTITIILQFTIIYTPFFNEVFKTQPLTIYELLLTLAASSIIFCSGEFEKWIKNRNK
ncbi:cation-translocating P-type ATPase [Flavobacterium gawalongense]|uniref:Cation-translocating P-type ATPase n=1 Tax=Flavobacterium gawalongense TaxID=2594432 RepID=A0A553BRA5_9FLAO|nr:cation-translocating P-type ATPase [Flavobacterium gawalongense]TRX10798.1 cation-translocating P-type ATPase [Flavobacterium gawalongense]TRX11520.1 cation-translocating P-type ATPase [Flavobacterium gawalongense]TRX29290.1 cation-translocating P-type ATPase [Flavobacterium gawalongense]